MSAPEASPGDELDFVSQQGGEANQPSINPVFAAQVVLDRLGFSPLVVDGKEGPAFSLALRGFQQANDLPETGQFDEPTRKALDRFGNVPPTITVEIPAAFARGPFDRDLPRDLSDQARFEHLGYRSMTEALTERFHTTPSTLLALNGPNTRLAAGAKVRVPNIANVDPDKTADDPRNWQRTLQLLGVSPKQPEADRLVVDKSDGALQVFDADDKLIAQFPVTTGSSHDPLPIGVWTVKGVARNPDYHYNPDLFWDASDSDDAARLPPGPNGPVGVVWIDLSKPHYGIHGTPEPQNIGHTESHGCVRLTNWDAARLAQMVSPGTKVIFEP